MSDPSSVQICIDHNDLKGMAPDASAGYELVLSEELQGRGAAEGKLFLHPVVTLKRNGALALPQTFSFIIDGSHVKAGRRYEVRVRYRINSNGRNGDRLEWRTTFVAESDAWVAPRPARMHGPCVGLTSACVDW
ncbi:hypothetical protein [Pseudomonas sp.]|uniref:hypothetical protein n=1 Tax=Pseudomonas sp. TaxID=306 RepID=UPI0028AFA0CB|nr:hypothetical protein [Pseudomonas sp.]